MASPSSWQPPVHDDEPLTFRPPACGRGYMAMPLSGDDSTRFCSTRCREAYDAGFPAWDKNTELNGHHLTPPLTGLRVIVGPPDVEIGSNPYQSVIVVSEKKRAKIEKRKKRENTAAKSKTSKRVSGVSGVQVTNKPLVHSCIKRKAA
jgi:hypothetical protein